MAQAHRGILWRYHGDRQLRLQVFSFWSRLRPQRGCRPDGRGDEFCGVLYRQTRDSIFGWLLSWRRVHRFSVCVFVSRTDRFKNWRSWSSAYDCFAHTKSKSNPLVASAVGKEGNRRLGASTECLSPIHCRVDTDQRSTVAVCAWLSPSAASGEMASTKHSTRYTPQFARVRPRESPRSKPPFSRIDFEPSTVAFDFWDDGDGLVVFGRFAGAWKAIAAEPAMISKQARIFAIPTSNFLSDMVLNTPSAIAVT